MAFFNIFSKKEKKEVLDAGLEKTKTSVFSKIARAVAGKSRVDDEVLDNLEEALITSDVGVETTLEIIQNIEQRVARDKYVNTSELHTILKEEIAALLTRSGNTDGEGFELPADKKPYVIMVVWEKPLRLANWHTCTRLPARRFISEQPTLFAPQPWSNSAFGENAWVCLSSSSKWGPTPPVLLTTLCLPPKPMMQMWC